VEPVINIAMVPEFKPCASRQATSKPQALICFENVDQPTTPQHTRIKSKGTWTFLLPNRPVDRLKVCGSSGYAGIYNERSFRLVGLRV
jgi:hypothetical protein